jgi:hypothetical protein
MKQLVQIMRKFDYTEVPHRLKRELIDYLLDSNDCLINGTFYICSIKNIEKYSLDYTKPLVNWLKQEKIGSNEEFLIWYFY